MRMELMDILKSSPDCSGYGGGKWAIYSVGCCWWTSFPDTDLGTTRPFSIKIKSAGGVVKNVDAFGLPCCPHCGAMLMQTPLEKFVECARNNPDHYGPRGLNAFVDAHSKNCNTCHQKWSEY